MTIIRDGKKVELTPEEMREAYCEQQKGYYAQDLKSKYEVSEEEANSLASKIDKALGWNDSYWECYWMTIGFVAEEFNLKERDECLN